MGESGRDGGEGGREGGREEEERGHDIYAKSMMVYMQMFEGVCEDNKPSTSLGVGGLFSNRVFGVFPRSVNIENQI